LFKHFQVDPGGQGDIWPEVGYDLKDRKHGTLTVKRCRSLEYFERHGDTELMKHACEVLDGEGIPMAARLFNSKIKCTALKMPPRKSKDEVPCIWEFVLED
jgi:hypothetical protein